MITNCWEWALKGWWCHFGHESIAKAAVVAIAVDTRATVASAGAVAISIGATAASVRVITTSVGVVACTFG